MTESADESSNLPADPAAANPLPQASPAEVAATATPTATPTDTAAKPARTRRPAARRTPVDAAAVGVLAAPSAEPVAAGGLEAAGAADAADAAKPVPEPAEADAPAVVDVAPVTVPAEPARTPRRRRAAPQPSPAAGSVLPNPSVAAGDTPAAVEAATVAASEAVAFAGVAEAAGSGPRPALVSDPAPHGQVAAADLFDGSDRADGAGGSQRGPRHETGGPRQPRPAAPGPQAVEVFAEVLSGAFDVAADATPDASKGPDLADMPDTPGASDAPAGAAEAAPRRILQPEPEAPKLHKVLAQAGVGSRRDMEQMIADGHVTVNGQPAHTGQRISFGDRIAVDGKPVKVRIQPPPPRLIAYHKPAGEIVTHDDPQQRPTVFRRLPRLPQGKWQSVGRLDVNTEGLLLFTNSGQLANQLMHPRFGVEREYAVRLLGRVDEAAAARLIAGIELDGQSCGLRSIDDGGGDGANHWYRVVITEGRNREVRRLFEAVGLTVSRLIRIRYGSVVLPRGLKRGVWVDLGDADMRAVRQLLAQAPRAPGDGRLAASAERPNGDHRPPRPPKDARAPRADDRGNRDARGPRPAQPQPPRNQRPNGPRPSPGPMAAGEPRGRADGFEREVDPDFEEEIDHARIPNPLEQTFDKRFVQNPRGPAGGRGFGQGGGGFGHGGNGPRGPARGPGKPAARGPREPDPMQTSVGYIGGDAFLRKAHRGGGGGGGGGNRGGNRGGQGGGKGGGYGGGFRGR